MKKYIIATCISLFAIAVIAAADRYIYEVELTRVIDGDTVEFKAPYLPKPLCCTLKLRVLGVDTPEKAPRAKCDSEAARGQAATEFTKHAVAEAKHIQIELVKWDKFGGRVLGDLIIDDQSLSSLLIQNGYARPYHGEAKKSWCDASAK
jgi:endonuclease YncB( thermonuclease family)